MNLIPVILSLFAVAAPVGQLTRPPELQHFVEATYPPEEFAERRGAEVVLEVDLDEKGVVTAARKTEVSLNPAPESAAPESQERFARAAIEAAAQFRFSPAEIDGKPAPVRITYRYRFAVKEEKPAMPADAPVVIEGRLLERGNRRPLVGVSVAVEGGAATETDGQGHFALRGIPPGRWRLSAVSPDHDRYQTEEEVKAGEKTEVVYYLHRRSTSPYEMVVQGDRARKEVAKRSLSLEEIKRVPGTSGDAVAVVQMLPGVARVPYGLGLLPVRGTQPKDTAGYLDGIAIPNIFHFGGLPISVVNSDALAGMDFYPGNFSARFGRAMGGAVELRGRAGASDGIHGYGDVSLYDAKAFVEAPTSEKGSLIATARRSYADLLLSAAGVDSVSPRYYDYLLRHDWKLTGGRAAVYVYGSSDALSLNLKHDQSANPVERERWTEGMSFHRLQGLYERSLGSEVTARAVAAVGYDGLDMNFGSLAKADAQFWSLQLRTELDWTPSPEFQLSAGLDSGMNRIDFDVTTATRDSPDRIDDPLLERRLMREADFVNYATPGLFIQGSWSPVPSLRLVPGLRADMLVGRRLVTSGRVDPRLSVFYELTPWITLKAAAGLYSGPPALSHGEMTQRFGNPNLVFQQSAQYMAGATVRLSESSSLDVQAYYKDLSKIVVPSGRFVERGGILQSENFTNGGAGFSRGIELMLRQELASGFFGWLSYTLSESRQRPQEGSPITHFPFDQTHNVFAMVSQKLPRDWTVGGSVRYTTGNWFTPIVRGVYDSDGDVYQPIRGKLYSERLPDFFELDLRIDKRWVYDRWSLTVYLDLRNVTNRRNVEMSSYNYDYTRRVDMPGLPLFPNLGVRGEF